MNIQKWIATRQPNWDKLEAILEQINRGGMAGLSPDELRDLGRLYRSASADLSRVRALNVGGQVGLYLNNLVVRAHNQVYRMERDRFKDLLNFFWSKFPQLVCHHILYVLAAFIIFAVPLVGSYAVSLRDPSFPQLELINGHPLLSDQIWDDIEHHKMWTTSIAGASPYVSSSIATNNIRVAIMGFAFGITFGIGTTIVLAMNGLLIGTVLGVCHNHGMAHDLLLFVAPHGVLELTAIFISGGSGLMLGRALSFPGQLSRMDSLRLAAKPALQLFAGCVPLLLVAGLLEGYVSPNLSIAPEIKLLLSLATLICLLCYLFVPRKACK